MRSDHTTLYVDVEKLWRERSALIPWLSFPSTWQVHIIPPFGGATARFVVRLAPASSWDSADPKARSVSVYLDFDHALGYFGVDMNTPESYWEIYPAIDGGTRRFALNETEQLMGAIALSLTKEQR